MTRGATLSLVISTAAGTANSAGGWVTILAPVDMEILEDGRVLGTTRMERLMLPVGSHRLELANAALEFTTARTVQVAAGKTANCRGIAALRPARGERRAVGRCLPGRHVARPDAARGAGGADRHARAGLSSSAIGRAPADRHGESADPHPHRSGFEKMTMRTTVLFCAAALLAVGVPARAADEELLASAKSLYESASYEAALSEFSAIHASELADTVDTYKALCLLGLGRTREAEQALELVVTRRPLLVLNDAEYSPRVVALFRDVRKKALPAAAQQLYLAARTDYENKKYDVAATGFTQVLQIIAEIGADAQTTTLADLKELATGFATLADAKSAAPAPPPPRAAAPARGCGAGAPAPAAAATAPPPPRTAAPAPAATVRRRLPR